MTGLIVVAVVMTAAVVAVLSVPLLRRPEKSAATRAAYDLAVYRDQLREIERDQERGLLDTAEAEAARTEVKRRMLAADAAGSTPDTPPPVSGRVLAGGLGVTVAVVATGIYLLLGSPEIPNYPFAKRNLGTDMVAQGAGPEHGELAKLADKLAAKLKDHPDDLQGWILLARTYQTVGQHQRAVAAYKRATELSGQRPELAVLYGDAMVRAADGQVTEQAFEVFNKIVAVEPMNPQARYYVGLGLAQRGQTMQALQEWVDLKALSPADAPWLGVVNDQIGRAEGELKLAAGSVKPSAAALDLAKRHPPSTAAAVPTQAMPAQPGPSAADVEAAGQMSAADRNQMIRSMVARLAARLKDNPNDVEGWRRLARSYRVLGDTEKAAAAEARVDALTRPGAATPTQAMPAQPGPSAADVEAAGQMSAADRNQMIRSMVARLAARLKDNPNDLEGWRRLARSYRVLGDTGKAEQAEARVRELESRR